MNWFQEAFEDSTNQELLDEILSETWLVDDEWFCEARVECGRRGIKYPF